MRILVTWLIAPLVSLAIWALIYFALGTTVTLVLVGIAGGAMALTLGFVALTRLIGGKRVPRRIGKPVIG